MYSLLMTKVIYTQELSIINRLSFARNNLNSVLLPVQP